MKRLYTTLFSLLLLALALPVAAQDKVVVWKKSGEKISVPLSDLHRVTFSTVTDGDDGKVVNGHAFVDLGLPSGTLWAACNIGADEPTGLGSYFAWGETSVKERYDNSNSVWYDTDYPHDVLTAEHDAATVAWGAPCRLPTMEEYTELYQNCTWTWKVNYSGSLVNGFLATSDVNGNSVFFPAAGLKYGDEVDFALGTGGDYWSSTSFYDGSNKGGYAFEFSYDIDNNSTIVLPGQWYWRCYGFSVRAVTR